MRGGKNFVRQSRHGRVTAAACTWRKTHTHTKGGAEEEMPKKKKDEEEAWRGEKERGAACLAAVATSSSLLFALRFFSSRETAAACGPETGRETKAEGKGRRRTT